MSRLTVSLAEMAREVFRSLDATPFFALATHGCCRFDITPLTIPANTATRMSQMTMITGKKQQKTTNAAAIHLNMIFKTDQNGISKSTTETRCENNTGGGVGRGGVTTRLGDGNCVPYFNIGR